MGGVAIREEVSIVKELELSKLIMVQRVGIGVIILHSDERRPGGYLVSLP